MLLFWFYFAWLWNWIIRKKIFSHWRLEPVLHTMQSGTLLSALEPMDRMEFNNRGKCSDEIVSLERMIRINHVILLVIHVPAPPFYYMKWLMWGEGKAPEFQIHEEFRFMVVFKPSEIIVESFLSIKTLTQKTAFLRAPKRGRHEGQTMTKLKHSCSDDVQIMKSSNRGIKPRKLLKHRKKSLDLFW